MTGVVWPPGLALKMSIFLETGRTLRWTAGVSVEEKLGHTPEMSLEPREDTTCSSLLYPRGNAEALGPLMDTHKYVCRLGRAARDQLGGVPSQGRTQVEKRD